MVNVAVALVATLAALGCAGLLGVRGIPERRIHFFSWTFTLAVLGLALGAMTVGYAAGFSPALLRCVTLFGALLAPFSLALGVVELVARTVQARFAARLIAGSYVVVAVVIVLLDPIIGTFDKSLPKAAGHYSSLPKLIINGAHVFAVVALVSCVAVTAMRGNKRDRQATEIMLTVAMVAFAGVLLVTATRGFLPGPLAPLALGGAVALTWFGVARVLPKRTEDDEEDEEEAEPYDEMSNYAGQPPLGRPSGPPPQSPASPGHQTGGQYPAQPSYAPQAVASGPVPFPLGQYGRITMYTLHDGHQEAFDRLAAEVTRAVIEREPGTLVYACHSVDSAPLQRIFYQLFRDAAAVENHTRQPHVQRFAGEVRAHVAGTNVIELTATAAKVAPPLDVQRPSHDPQRPAYDQSRPQDPQRPPYEQPRPQEPQWPAYDAQRPHEPQRAPYEQPRPQEPQRPAYDVQRPQEPQRAPYDPSRQPAAHRPHDMTGPRPVQRPAQDPGRPPHDMTGPRPVQQPPNGRPPHQPNPSGRWPHG